ncbi:MAG: integrase core domain-containing protein [Bacillota bacterium]
MTKKFTGCVKNRIFFYPAILEAECYSRHEFESFPEAYREISRYMEYYNRIKRHGSLGYLRLMKFHKALMSKTMRTESFVA